MKKTLTVNLNNTVYHIDEDAYESLQEYLNSLRNHFAEEEGADEILSDIEARIAELFKEQVSGNPGFDFYSANKDKVIIFGEAKYSSSRNAYGIGMEQVDRFIREAQDVSDLNDIDKFFEEESLQLADKGDKAYAVAFAAKGTASDMIINGIVSNKHYKNIAINKEVIFLAVNV